LPLIHWISAEVPEEVLTLIDPLELRVIRTEALIEWFKLMREARCFQDCIQIADKFKSQPIDDWLAEIVDEQLEITKDLFRTWLNEWKLQGALDDDDHSPILRYGLIYRRNYPWMTGEHMR
jgi:hypothetical protein